MSPILVTSTFDSATFEEALADSLSGLGWTVTRTGTDLQAKIAEHGAVIRVSIVPGGNAQSWQTVARVRVEVFAAKYAKAWDTAKWVDELWLAAGHFAVGDYRIDRVVNESAFAEHYYHESVRLLAAVYRVTTRTRLP